MCLNSWLGHVTRWSTSENKIWLMGNVSSLNRSMFLQTTLAVDAHIAGGELFHEQLTLNITNILWFQVWTLWPIEHPQERTELSQRMFVCGVSRKVCNFKWYNVIA